MKRPILNEIPLSSVKIERGSLLITIDPGAWDMMIKCCYNQGFVVLEIEDEKPVRAYQKPAAEIVGTN